MLRSWLWVVALVATAGALNPEEEAKAPGDLEAEAAAYLQQLDADMSRRANEGALADWAYESNITDENLAFRLNVSAQNALFQKQQWQETIKYPWQTFQSADLVRQFQKYSVLGTAALPEDKFDQYQKIVSDMQSIYGTAKVCDYNDPNKCDLALEPELTEIFAKSRDAKELSYYWVEWRRASGEKTRSMYAEYAALSNEAAILNNFTDNSAYWLKDYEAADFKDQVATLWQQVKPLYDQIHAYVRRKLWEQYGEEVVSRTGPIPASLLGNMWAQTWNNIYDISVPYPNQQSVDVTQEMINQGYTPLRMFKLSEEFFTSLNLSAMPDTFWSNSIIEKPADGRELICHASAWDFYDSKDFRIKMCTRVNMEDLFTVHHEMGHIQYFLQYKDQPLVYKEGANPGFHEAVGDVMALSVSTPKHLKKIGLLEVDSEDPEATINFLYLQGLTKIAFLPYGYLMDLWRWGIFGGSIGSDTYNCEWWKLREQYQGLEPPVDRTEEDFDPGAKYHIVASVPYIRYFVSYIVQFQFHRSLCLAAGEFDPNDPAKPLHRCDIYQSAEAGSLLGKMLQLGSSKTWMDAMEQLTGIRTMDASGLLDYFKPLMDWLVAENNRTGELIGWNPTQKLCTPTRLDLEKKKMETSKPQTS